MYKDGKKDCHSGNNYLIDHSLADFSEKKAIILWHEL
jgi:hypothetical protein